jgi:hypothetical protein|tara:strand:- start:176 stop:1258 length:1083 start_codon:yes stop_codon:yes gene_type:complete
MRNFARTLRINLSLIVLIAIVTELIFGGWIGTNYGLLIIPKNFYRKFDVSHLYDNNGEAIYYKRDKHGLRGEYGAPSKIDILTIGGSTTDELFIDEGKTWSDTIARFFAMENKKITVANAGVGGQTTVGHSIIFEQWFPIIPDMKVRYVLAYIGINDIALLDDTLDDIQYLDSIQEENKKVKQYLLNNSALYTLLRNLRGMVRARSANLIHNEENWDGSQWTEPPKQPDIDKFIRNHAPALNAYGVRIKHLAQIIHNFGAKPIFVTQNNGKYRIRKGKVYLAPRKDGTLNYTDYIMMAAMARVTMKTCQVIDAICIDIANELFFVDGDHYDGIHTTPTGSEKIGRYLHSKLKDIIPATDS